jgi:hypothetical protein
MKEQQMSYSVFTVSIHTDNGSIGELIAGVWEQTFSNFDRAQALYELIEDGLSDLEEEYTVILRTIKVTDINEPYELQVYNENMEVFEDFSYKKQEELVNEIFANIMGDS